MAAITKKQPCGTCHSTDYTFVRGIECSNCADNRAPSADIAPPKIERWFQTFTGKLVDVEHPTPDAVDIQDIAHALSMTCRYGGHCREFYSVAEHSVHVMILGEPHVSNKLRLSLLLHDAAEAYVGDIISPVKKLLSPLSTELEDKWLRAIQEKFDLGDGLTNTDPVVQQADALALSVEVLSLFYPVLPEWWQKFPIPTRDQYFPVECWSPKEARGKFLDNFHRIREDLGYPRV